MKDGAIELESLETRKKGMELFIPRLPASAVSSSLHTVHPRIDQIDSPRTLDPRHCSAPGDRKADANATQHRRQNATSTDFIARASCNFFLIGSPPTFFLPH